MAPALTRILRNDHGIHLSSPPSSVRVDPDAGAVTSAVELEPPGRSTDGGDLQKISLNLCSLGYLYPVDRPVHPEPLARGPAPGGRGEMLARPAPGSLVGLPRFSKCQGESRQVATVFPGATGMFVIALPEHNSQEAILLHGPSARHQCGPDGGDVRPSSLILPSVRPSYSQGETAFPNLSSMYATQPTVMYEEWERTLGPPACSRQPGTGFANPDRLQPGRPLEDAAGEQLSRHEALQGRACRLQRRLRALLGEHALKHCSQQLEGLRNHFQPEDVALESSLDSVTPPQTCSGSCFSWDESITASPFFAEVADFCESSQMVLRGLQEALDSEATGSSSSDDESEEDTLLPSGSSSGKMQWLEERAELSSRWIWLQLRVSELDGRIEQLVELHKHIRSTKGTVVLAQSQPLTDMQIQQTLMREMAGLSCTASDADADGEPCSPTRLLYNIERQSAQLSQIVNSLMPPLSLSPLSKQPSNGRPTFTSTHGGDDVFLAGTSKGRRLKSRRLFRVDASCVCARTRPMVACHKRKLFSLTSCATASSPKSRNSKFTLFSTCSSCDSVCLCSEHDCSYRSRLRPTVPLSSGNTTSHHFQKIVGREEWVQRPLIIKSKLSCSPNYGRNSSTPRHNSRKCKQHARQRNKREVLGLSPIRSPGSAWSQRRRSNQRKRKRGRLCRLTKDDEDVLYQLCDLGDGSDDILEENFSQFTLSQVSQGFLGRHPRGRVYNIDDIVIPVSLSKVEKLPYKDILTPSWRVVDIQGLTATKAGDDKKRVPCRVQIEDLGDEVFARRHRALEQREKRRWSSWEKRKRCRPSTRSGSRLSSSGGGMCTSGEESSVEWSCAQLDSDEQPRSEEWLPRAPWESRVFPLDEHEEAALLSDEEKIPSGWTESSCMSFSSKSSISHSSPTQSACTPLPSSGQNTTCTSSGS
ncbi:KAT8 regulatory NSL complex subunit 1-like protein isoform X1 [Fundulus heteroclitus]|uniref:KAT8 regulatory NSL complex subunit 1-like protein isoform X1 n=1 Tax=Fundulus heteroclitus TaxID=8078 RepID=UPI00165BDA38|nr:KAT8 regulatory NSL complex subunit 1-like protein isoform X1 [Fundulus heteroclitus]